MTHGTGFVGGGGGGGGGYHGGGGWSSSHYSRHHSSHYSSGGGGNGDCEKCCGVCCMVGCTFLGLLLCLQKMTLGTRIAVTWSWMFILSLTVGMIVGLKVYGPRTFDVAGGDMRPITDGVSSLMCTGVKLESMRTFNAYLLENKLEQSPTESKHSTVFRTSTLKYNQFEYWGFYLLKNSKISVKTCTDNNVDLMIIKGRNNLDSWLKDGYCSSCFLQYYTIPRTVSLGSQCTDTSVQTKNLSIANSEEYYFVYVNKLYYSSIVNLDVTFDITRTLYNTSNAISHCTNDDNIACELDFTSDFSGTIIFYASDFTEDDVMATSSCVPNIMIYCMFFIVCPLALGILLTVIFVCMYGRKTKRVNSPMHERSLLIESSPPSAPEEHVNPPSNNPSYLPPPSNNPYDQPPPSYNDIVINQPSK